MELYRQPSRLLANILRRGAARPLSSHSEVINIVLTTLVKFKPRLLARCQTLLPDVLLRSKIEFSEKKKTGFYFCSKSPSLTHNSKNLQAKSCGVDWSSSNISSRKICWHFLTADYLHQRSLEVTLLKTTPKKNKQKKCNKCNSPPPPALPSSPLPPPSLPLFSV